MSEGLKSSLTLAAKILVILVLPLLLFRYVDSQPVPAVQEEEDEATRSVAVVNEDTGIIQEEEKLILGQEIPALLNEQKDYKWTVVNRSAAEQGFSNQKYDAIIYVPSTFSENIMTFKEDKPTKAALNYVIQPNLEAKDRQRIHREMATAKNKINEEMSTIYWSYVSKEVDNIRAQFDKILEKEVAFQDAMYSFYTPSSKTLAHEIDQHKNNLENILNQTDQINDVSSDSANAANEAENKMKTFTEALEAYKETQLEQQKLLEAAQTKNQEAIAGIIEEYNTKLSESMAKKQEQISKMQDSVVFLENQNRNLLENYSTNVAKGKNAINDWVEWERSNKEIYTNLNTEINSIIDSYIDGIDNQKRNAAREDAVKAVNLITNAPVSMEIGDLNKPENSTVSLEEFRENLSTLEGEIKAIQSLVETSPPDNSGEGEGENTGDSTQQGQAGINNVVELPILDWDSLYTSIHDISDALSSKEGEINKGLPFEGWDNLVTEYENIFKQIKENRKGLVQRIVDNIDKKQGAINNQLEDELKVGFPEKDSLKKKTIDSLIIYNDSLTVVKTTLQQKTNINEEIIKEIDKLNIDLKMKELFVEVNQKYTDRLSPVFGVASDEINQLRNQSPTESFSEVLNGLESTLNENKEIIQAEQANTNDLIKALQQNATEITNQLQTVNADTFEWQESPSLEYLDGQMVFSIQQGTASDLKQLSDLVTNLEENQSEITTNTKDLQAQISTVQKQSDELNNKWSVNVASTGLIREDAYEILGNTVVDGQENPFVYNHLANPVNVEGQVNGKVLSETEERVPPVVMFMIILISGLLIGFLSHYYSNNTYLVQGGLFLLLNLAVGMIISIYGLNLYELDDAQAIKWSVFTILLLMACANVVRGGLFIRPFVGWLASIAMIVFFITPLLNIVVPEFTFNNPVSNVYMGLQYGTETSFILTIIVLAAITLAISAFIYTLQVMRNKARVEPNEEKAS
ncbi:type VII secretion protein EsaA [Virgibacillus halodenitrificans]|uniref:type VII secretion protein EsaA n=1 Tax=Virgibacillus halodenitrificans TaxID=1482 RepID=UPI00136B84AB|nr:type VII secretion protein EsaA [Virgibacillus halodenitrificans]MYL47229.1 type VII secretion protein EsaA [Virgibacillus halodenitrificans]